MRSVRAIAMKKAILYAIFLNFLFLPFANAQQNGAGGNFSSSSDPRIPTGVAGSALGAAVLDNGLGAFTAQTLGQQMQAPRRNKLTMSLGAINPTYATPVNATLSTFMSVVPLETKARAIRIAAADPYSIGMQIVSATAYPSDSYSGLLPAAFATGSNTTVIPTKNSVYQTGTITNGSNQITGLTTASLPTSSTVYVVGSGIGIDVTATVVNATTMQLSSNATISATETIQFSNMSTGCPLYFDNQGADADTINTAGVSRSLTTPGNAASLNNNPQSFTLQWSDFVPCSTIARADGGVQPLMMIFVTLGPNTTAYGRIIAANNSYNNNIASSYGNRFIYTGRPWNNNGNWADVPQTTGWTSYDNQSPLAVIQYLADAAGHNVLQVGDSISTAPGNDGLSTPIWRACMAISTPQAPCQWSSLAWGGTASAVYLEAFRRNAAALAPSAVVAQPISRNDGATIAGYQMLLSKIESYVTTLNKSYPVRLGFYGAFPFTTTLDGNSTAQADVTTIRADLLAENVGCTPSSGGTLCPSIPSFDPIPLVSRSALGGNFWDYLGISATASSAVAAGVTTIPYSGGLQRCYPGDTVIDTTKPSAIATNSVVISCNTTGATVASNVVIGTGIASGDTLVFQMPGWSGGALTDDNTHPNYAGVALVTPAATAMLKTMLGIR